MNRMQQHRISLCWSSEGQFRQEVKSTDEFILRNIGASDVHISGVVPNSTDDENFHIGSSDGEGVPKTPLLHYSTDVSSFTRRIIR